MSAPQPQNAIGLHVLELVLHDPDTAHRYHTSPELHATLYAVLTAPDDRAAVELLLRAVVAGTALHEGAALLARAVHDAGPRPDVHAAISARHRREWPSLWRAIDVLTGRRRDD